MKYFPVLCCVALLGSPAAAGQEADFWPDYEEVFGGAFAGYDSEQDVTVEMVGPVKVVHSTYGQWSLVFRAGSKGLGSGGGVAVAFRHVSGWGTSQSFDPGASSYVTVSTTSQVKLRLRTPDNFSIFNRHFYEYFSLAAHHFGRDHRGGAATGGDHHAGLRRSFPGFSRVPRPVCSPAAGPASFDAQDGSGRTVSARSGPPFRGDSAFPGRGPERDHPFFDRGRGAL